jgi:hypothetical protein
VEVIGEASGSFIPRERVKTNDQADPTLLAAETAEREDRMELDRESPSLGGRTAL